MVAELVDEFANVLGVGDFSVSELSEYTPGYMWGGTDLPMPIGPVGAQLTSLGTGPGAICYLDAIDVAALDAEERIAYLQAWQRQQAWLAGKTQAALLAVAGPEPEPDIVDGVRSFERDDWARDEIAAALGASTRAAAARVHTARVLGRCLKATQERLDAGDITWQHAQTLVDECTGLPDSAVRAVEARVLERAPHQTVANFRRSVRRAVLAVADADAQLAEAVAKTQRGVWVRPEPDGMATLSAFLPAIEAHAAYQLIDQSARELAAASPSATKPFLDDSRADAFLALLGVDFGVARGARSALRRSSQAGRRHADRSGGAPSDPSRVGTGANRIGTGASRVGTSRHRRRLGRLIGSQLAAASQRGAVNRPRRASQPGAASPVGATSHPGGASGQPSAGATNPFDTAAGVNVLHGLDVRSDDAGEVSLGAQPNVSVELQVVIDADALAGVSDNPAELIGYGPLSAGVAREFFAEFAGDVKLRRLVTDPVTGHLLDYGRSTYRIPKPLADYIRARDRKCRFPGCLRPPSACDVDHVISWNDGGKTAASNCACLCRRHHRLKTHGGWGFELRRDGSCMWTSPTGQEYVLDPPIQLDPSAHLDGSAHLGPAIQLDP